MTATSLCWAVRHGDFCTRITSGTDCLGIADDQTTSHAETKLPPCYFKDALLSLRRMGAIPPAHLPEDVKLQPTRGRRGGLWQRQKQQTTAAPLDTQQCKIGDEQNRRALCQQQDLLRIQRTRLHQDIPDSRIELEGFSLIRADTTDLSEKSRLFVSLRLL